VTNVTLLVDGYCVYLLHAFSFTSQVVGVLVAVVAFTIQESARRYINAVWFRWKLVLDISEIADSFKAGKFHP
jgi:hypothetical protein